MADLDLSCLLGQLAPTPQKRKKKCKDAAMNSESALANRLPLKTGKSKLKARRLPSSLPPPPDVLKCRSGILPQPTPTSMVSLNGVQHVVSNGTFNLQQTAVNASIPGAVQVVPPPPPITSTSTMMNHAAAGGTAFLSQAPPTSFVIPPTPTMTAPTVSTPIVSIPHNVTTQSAAVANPMMMVPVQIPINNAQGQLIGYQMAMMPQQNAQGATPQQAIAPVVNAQAPQQAFMANQPIVSTSDGHVIHQQPAQPMFSQVLMPNGQFQTVQVGGVVGQQQFVHNPSNHQIQAQSSIQSAPFAPQMSVDTSQTKAQSSMIVVNQSESEDDNNLQIDEGKDRVKDSSDSEDSDDDSSSDDSSDGDSSSSGGGSSSSEEEENDDDSGTSEEEEEEEDEEEAGQLTTASVTASQAPPPQPTFPQENNVVGGGIHPGHVQITAAQPQYTAGPTTIPFGNMTIPTQISYGQATAIQQHPPTSSAAAVALIQQQQQGQAQQTPPIQFVTTAVPPPHQAYHAVGNNPAHIITPSTQHQQTAQPTTFPLFNPSIQVLGTTTPTAPTMYGKIPQVPMVNGEGGKDNSQQRKKTKVFGANGLSNITVKKSMKLSGAGRILSKKVVENKKCDSSTSPSSKKENATPNTPSYDDGVDPVDDLDSFGTAYWTYGRRRITCNCPNCIRDGPRAKRRTRMPGEVLDKVKREHVCHIPDCGKVYLKTSHLRAHLLWHAGERPYVCQHENCEKRFTRSDELQRHERTHTGERRFSCSLCGKSFTRSDHLSKHHKTHYKNSNFDPKLISGVEKPPRFRRAKKSNSIVASSATTPNIRDGGHIQSVHYQYQNVLNVAGGGGHHIYQSHPASSLVHNFTIPAPVHNPSSQSLMLQSNAGQQESANTAVLTTSSNPTTTLFNVKNINQLTAIPDTRLPQQGHHQGINIVDQQLILEPSAPTATPVVQSEPSNNPHLNLTAAILQRNNTSIVRVSSNKSASSNGSGKAAKLSPPIPSSSKAPSSLQQQKMLSPPLAEATPSTSKGQIEGGNAVQTTETSSNLVNPPLEDVKPNVAELNAAVSKSTR